VTPRLLHLIVPSPDRRRVLARPSGLAGWALPAVPIGEDLAAGDGWSDTLRDAAARVVGSPVRPVREVTAAAWEVEATGRVPAVGVTWVGLDEAGRLGADAEAVRRWAALDEGDAPRG
jgi:hypothetical protein